MSIYLLYEAAANNDLATVQSLLGAQDVMISADHTSITQSRRLGDHNYSIAQIQHAIIMASRLRDATTFHWLWNHDADLIKFSIKRLWRTGLGINSGCIIPRLLQSCASMHDADYLLDNSIMYQHLYKPEELCADAIDWIVMNLTNAANADVVCHKLWRDCLVTDAQMVYLLQFSSVTSQTLQQITNDQYRCLSVSTLILLHNHVHYEEPSISKRLDIIQSVIKHGTVVVAEYLMAQWQPAIDKIDHAIMFGNKDTQMWHYWSQISRYQITADRLPVIIKYIINSEPNDATTDGKAVEPRRGTARWRDGEAVEPRSGTARWGDCPITVAGLQWIINHVSAASLTDTIRDDIINVAYNRLDDATFMILDDYMFPQSRPAAYRHIFTNMCCRSLCYRGLLAAAIKWNVFANVNDNHYQNLAYLANYSHRLVGSYCEILAYYDDYLYHVATMYRLIHERYAITIQSAYHIIKNLHMSIDYISVPLSTHNLIAEIIADIPSDYRFIYLHHTGPVIVSRIGDIILWLPFDAIPIADTGYQYWNNQPDDEIRDGIIAMMASACRKSARSSMN